MADIQKHLCIKYKDKYQKSRLTIESRIFISFIWPRSELWKCYNDNVFTKKLIFTTYIGMSRFPQPYLLRPRKTRFARSKNILYLIERFELCNTKKYVVSGTSRKFSHNTWNKWICMIFHGFHMLIIFNFPLFLLHKKVWLPDKNITHKSPKPLPDTQPRFY